VIVIEEITARRSPVLPDHFRLAATVEIVAIVPVIRSKSCDRLQQSTGT
jgi:hypothetical protein